MRYLLAPIFLIYKLWIGLVFWGTLALLYPLFLVLLSKKEWYPRAFALKRYWSYSFQLLLLCPVMASFRAPLPKSPYIIVSNHSSYLDTVFMYSVFKDYFLFVGKGELLKWPMFSRFFKTMDIPVERENSVKAWDALQKAYEALERGECIAMYPEGTIPRDAPRMKAFKNGAFRMSVDKNVPVVPVTWLRNSKVMLDPSQLFSFSLPQQILVVVHPPVYPLGKDLEDVVNLRSRVFDMIDSALPPQYRSKNEN